MQDERDDRPFIRDNLIGETGVERVRALIARRESDLERWSGQDAINRSWDRRLRRAAGKLQPGWRVLDLGCGSMSLRDHLPAGCTYISADIVKRSDDTHLIEINKGIWPGVQADIVVALGVLEYVYDAPDFFKRAKKCAPALIFTYNMRMNELPRSMQARLENGWLSDFSMNELVSGISESGGRVLEASALSQKRDFSEYFFEVQFLDATSQAPHE